ncbi:NACHT domain-containing protein [Saccharothrix saharensis]|uniref:NACHT domain-containing protein n=1 Tax=Saccharothrix saharensis TaxID=571190 RepID=A0A543JG89_9PSEU|nr:NACHT domain-containing protein [Saccharothrix saharensis]TQM81859.1 NACHT domain-containing protein [Saccharothrix saharensis]
MALAQESPKSLIDQLRELVPFLPDWLLKALLLVLVLGLVMAGLMHWLPTMRFVGRLVRRLSGGANRRRAHRRARFADHVESQMRRLGEKEEWRDSRYAELEAELEISGGGKRLFRKRPLRALRRVPSLSVALEESDERIVLLEGEPGAGKSVAMRHLAQRMAASVLRHPSEDGVIPIYVNLKTFTPAAWPPSADDVREFVLRAVNQVRDRDVERFLADEFQPGVEAGTWLFLFDSFDEIPAILSATEADEVITGYADAVHGFLHGMNKCRGVVASREFRGPGRSEWPRFRVVPLSRKRKIDLIEKAELPVDVERMLIADLPTADIGVQQMSDNPLFLGLLCEHMREGNVFPTNVHSVLETYVEHRLRRDEAQVSSHYRVSREELREVAEELAFTIAEQESMGLDVDKAVAVAVVSANLQRSADEVARAVEALIYTKLARTGDSESSVTFSHRRLQEYFATCVAIRDSARVDVRLLLTDGRWRETAVTILQTQDPREYGELLVAVRAVVAEGSDDALWPPRVLYVLHLLAEGGNRPGPDVAERAGRILRRAWRDGQRYDRKWALEVVAAADRDTVVELLREAFKSPSEWLRQEAYKQVRKVPDVAGEVTAGIRQTLLDLSVGGVLWRNRRSVLSQVSRLPDSAGVVRYFRSLLLAPFLHVVTLVLNLVLLTRRGGHPSVLDLSSSLAVGLMVFYALRLSLASASVRASRLRYLHWLIAPRDDSNFTAVLRVVGMSLYLTILGGFLVGAVFAGSLLDAALSLAAAANVLLVAVLLTGLHVGGNVWSEARRLAGVAWRGLLGSVRPVLAGCASVAGLGAIALVSRDTFLIVVGGLVLTSLLGAVVMFTAGFVRGRVESVTVRRYLRSAESEPVTRAGLVRFLTGVRSEASVLRLLAVIGRSEGAVDGELGDALDELAAAMGKPGEVRALLHPGQPEAAWSEQRGWVRSTTVLDEINVLLERSRRKAEFGVTPPSAAGRAGRG